MGEGGLQAQGDPPAGEPSTDRVVLTSDGHRAGALTVRCISMGAPPLSWVQDGRAGGEPAGQAPWARTGLDNLNLLSVNNEDMASVRRDRTYALADRIDGRPVQFVAED
jgi:hypothetical protein